MTLEATITKMMWIMGMGDQTFGGDETGFLPVGES